VESYVVKNGMDPYNCPNSEAALGDPKGETAKKGTLKG
jgi:hypothetical protein